MTINAIPTCVFSKSKVNELKQLDCNCRDLVQQGHGSLIFFYHLSMLNNNFKEIRNC